MAGSTGAVYLSLTGDRERHPERATVTRILALLAVVGTLLLYSILSLDGQPKTSPSSKSSAGAVPADGWPLDGQTISKLAYDWLGIGPSSHASQYSAERAGARVHLTGEAVRLCPACNCSQEGAYVRDQSFAVPVPTVEDLRSRIEETGSFGTVSTLRYLLHEIPLASALHGLWLTGNVSTGLLQQQFNCPDSIISYNFTQLALDKPTQYVYTRTGPSGRLKTWADRRQYMQRHVEMLRSFKESVDTEGYEGGVPSGDRQQLWIVVEDSATIEPGLEELLRNSGLPYLYFAYGPTRHYGKAQWNVVLMAVQVLRDGFFGDGPVYNLDDDARILPELLIKLWRLRKAVVFQVGNLEIGPESARWEGPVYENGKVVSWSDAWSEAARVYPIDMNGFAINSSLIGPGRPLSFPQYIPFDAGAGESEFLEKIYPARADMEPLCKNTLSEKCYYAWHNSFMSEGFKDEEPPQ